MLAVVMACAGFKVATADHNVYLPLVPNTPLMQQLVKAQEYTYCLDTRAAAYPNFASQLEDVNAQYAERVGIRSRLVSFNDVACQVKHVMPSSLICDGWAARIYYANWPVIVEYCYTLGYQDWRSAQGHELGHGLLGLHEQYKDSGGSIACTGKTWTVMDCGGGVRYPQPTDVDRGCSSLKTVWCGSPLPVACAGSTDAFGNVWDACLQRWVAPTGWTYDPVTATWFTPAGVAEWGECRVQDNDCWNIPAQRWVFRGSVLYDPVASIFSRPPLP